MMLHWGRRRRWAPSFVNGPYQAKRTTGNHYRMDRFKRATSAPGTEDSCHQLALVVCQRLLCHPQPIANEDLGRACIRAAGQVWCGRGQEALLLGLEALQLRVYRCQADMTTCKDFAHIHRPADHRLCTDALLQCQGARAAELAAETVMSEICPSRLSWCCCMSIGCILEQRWVVLVHKGPLRLLEELAALDAPEEKQQHKAPMLKVTRPGVNLDLLPEGGVPGRQPSAANM